MKFLRWLIAVALSLVPIAFTSLALLNRGLAITAGSLVGRGELALVTAAMCSAGIVEVVGTGRQLRGLKLLAAGSALVVVSLASLYFADVSALCTSGGCPNSSIAAKVSIVLFVFGLVCTGACVKLSEE